MAKSGFNFDVILSNFKRNELPLAKQIAAAQRDYALKSFQRQGFGNAKWKQVKRRVEGTPEYMYPRKKGLSRRVKPILVLSGKLRRAVNNSIKRVTTKGTILQVNLPYAAIHNEGGRTGNGGKIAKRQYLGWNRELDKTIQGLIKKNTDKNFKG